MGEYLADIQSQNSAGASPPLLGLFVVYDLPDRDCAAAASTGQFSVADNGVAYYKEYIDSIRTLLTTYSDVKTILIIGK
jgi:cellulose 1,4-beta-cellobiosidase